MKKKNTFGKDYNKSARCIYFINNVKNISEFRSHYNVCVEISPKPAFLIRFLSFSVKKILKGYRNYN